MPWSAVTTTQVFGIAGPLPFLRAASRPSAWKNRFLAWAGFEEAAAAIEAGWAARDRERTTGALDDALVDEVAILGTADECRTRVRELAAGGVTTHIIACPSEDPDVRRRTLDAFRPAAFRLREPGP